MAVYTKIPEQELQNLLAHYGMKNIAGLKAIEEGVENSNYILEAEDKRYILTIYEKRVRHEELPFFLGLMEHLSKKGIPCPLPVHDQQGDVLQTVQGKPASIVSFLDGKWPKAIKNQHCSELGSMLARMHTASQDFKLHRKNNMSLACWHELYGKVKDRVPEVKGLAAAEIEQALARVDRNWPKDLPSGVIHGDLFPDNALFEDDRLTGIIDFYFACNDIFAYDIAICMNSWCFEQNAEFNITKARHLLSAYNEVRRINDRELELLPILAIGASIRFLMSRLYDWLNPVAGALVKPKDPMEYFRKLRFHMQVREHTEYGL